MQVNKTETLQYLMTLPSSFIVDDGSVTFTLKAPDGSQLGSIAGSVSSTTPSSSQTLNVVITVPTGGLYTGFWRCTVNNVVYLYPVNFWVTWTDVYESIRSLLGASTANIADSVISSELRNVDTTLRDYAPALPFYYQMELKSNLKGLLYSEGYDQGIVKLTASKIRSYIGGKRSSGEISLFKKGTTTAQWTSSQPKSTVTIEEQWWMDGMAILEANIPEIYQAAVEDRGGDEIMTRGLLVAPSCYVNTRGIRPPFSGNGGEFG